MSIKPTKTQIMTVGLVLAVLYAINNVSALADVKKAIQG